MSSYTRELCDRGGSAWTRFWFTPSDPIVLSLIRLFTGLVALWWYAGFYTDLQAWFGPAGLFRLDATQEWRGDRFAFSLLDFVDSASLLSVVYWIGFAILVLMAIGLFSRFATIASLIVILSFIHRAPMIARPIDDILAMLTFYLCIGPSGACFSVDAWLRTRREAARPGPSSQPESQFSSAATVAVRLMQVHVALVYAAMAIAQLQGDAWWRGTAAWWLMARPESRLVDLTPLHSMGMAFQYFVEFVTHAIVLYEICFALLIWNRLARPILLVLGVFFWIGIALVGGGLTFAAAMLVANLSHLPAATLRPWCSPGSTRAAVDYV